MSLDTIKLTPFLLQELFKKCLVESDAKELKEKENPTPISSFQILGNNRKNVIIIVENIETLYLPDNQLNFLLGILSACKLTMEDVAIINITKNKGVTYKSIELELKAEKIMLFGVTQAQINLPIEFPLYQIQQYNNQTYISASMLNAIEEDKIEKTKLWNCLKQIFLA
jgi:hypothetical protein